jgi:hypothetical protein
MNQKIPTDQTSENISKSFETLAETPKKLESLSNDLSGFIES